MDNLAATASKLTILLSFTILVCTEFLKLLYLFQLFLICIKVLAYGNRFCIFV